MKLIPSTRILTLMLLMTSTVSLGQWAKILDSPTYCLAANSSEMYVAYENIYRSTNDGILWDGPYLRNNSVMYLAAFDSVLFAATNIAGGGLYRSRPGDTAWTYQAFPDQYFHAIASNDSVMLLGPSMGAGSCGLYRSTNRGVNWTPLPSPPPGCLGDAIAIMGSSIYVGNWQGVSRSTNGGVSWSFVNSGLANQYVISFGVMGSTLFAGTIESGIFKLGTNLTTWTPINGGIDFPQISHIIVVDSNLFVASHARGGGGRVFLSTDLGGHWSNTGLAVPEIFSMVSFHDYLFVAEPHGVWRCTLSYLLTGVESDTRYRPGRYLVENNFPNPFNSGTTIRYYLPSHDHITLEVYDVLGRKVASLVDAVEPPGYKSVHFDASMLPGGVYYCRLKGENHVEMQKLILAK